MPLELAPDGGWLHAEGPLRLSVELARRTVLVWFFCASSSPAVESLDDVRALVRDFGPGGLAVVGVYSPQYRAEAARRHVVAAVDRLDVPFPVAVDTRLSVFRAFEARSWPTFAIIAPDGSVAARIAGAGNRELLTRTIGDLIAAHPRRPPLPDAVVRRYRSAGGLRFPGGVFAQVPSVGRPGRVFIADTGHHRIVETTWPDVDGQSRVRTIFGGGAGYVDGPASRARFCEPTGLAFDAERALLYVSDTGNHAIRRVDLNDGQVSTIIGSGTRRFDRRGGASGINQPLNAPTHIVLDAPRNRLFIAMTGLDQVWLADLDTLVTRALAGVGAAGLVDGPFETAAFWQPRALALDAQASALFTLDADASALRRLHLPARAVQTLIGSPEGFTGARDGPFAQAQFCHATGMTLVDSGADRHLLIADTYNSALRRLDLHAQTTTRMAAALPLFEPAAMHWSAGLPSRTESPRLFVADTGNHRVLQIDADGHGWQELRIGSLSALHEAPHPPPLPERAACNVPFLAPLRMEVALAPPLHAGLSPDLPVCVRVSTLEGPNAGEALFQSTRVPDAGAVPVSIDLPAHAVTERSVLLVELSLGLARLPGAPATPAYKSWRVRFGPDGGQPRLIADEGSAQIIRGIPPAPPDTRHGRPC